MVEFRWIQMFSFMMLLLHFTAVTGQYTSSIITVRDGDDLTLPCENVRDDQDQCDRTDWYFGSRDSVYLVKDGKITEETKSKSDRLSVTEKCSLVMKKVTDQDVGRYYCRQFDKSGRQHSVSAVVLSVVTMTEQQLDDKVTLSCSVLVYRYCTHTVKWVYEGKDVDEGNTDMKTSQSDCSVTVTFPTSYLKHKPNNHQLFQCKVTDPYNNKVQLFNFSVSSSDDNSSAGWWFYVVVAVTSAALLITVVVVIRWKRTKGNKTETDEKTRQRLNSADTQSGPGTSQDTADPEDGVSYASVSYIKKTSGGARVEHDEGDAVTYSTVKPSPSSAGASVDPENMYASVNKPTRVK